MFHVCGEEFDFNRFYETFCFTCNHKSTRPPPVFSAPQILIVRFGLLIDCMQFPHVPADIIKEFICYPQAHNMKV